MAKFTAVFSLGVILLVSPAFGFDCTVILGHLMATHDLRETELQVLQDLAEENRSMTVRDLIQLKRIETEIWRGWTINLSLDLALPQANGYRLPTAAEFYHSHRDPSPPPPCEFPQRNLGSPALCKKTQGFPIFTAEASG